jgi:hypothetical protein
MNHTEAPAAPDTRQPDDPAALVARLNDERAADIVEALNDLTPDIAAAVLLGLLPERAVEVLDQPGLDRGPEIVARLPREVAASLLSSVSSDRLADLCRQLDEPHQRPRPSPSRSAPRPTSPPTRTAGRMANMPTNGRQRFRRTFIPSSRTSRLPRSTTRWF